MLSQQLHSYLYVPIFPRTKFCPSSCYCCYYYYYYLNFQNYQFSPLNSTGFSSLLPAVVSAWNNKRQVSITCLSCSCFRSTTVTTFRTAFYSQTRNKIELVLGSAELFGLLFEHRLNYTKILTHLFSVMVATERATELRFESVATVTLVIGET